MMGTLTGKTAVVTGSTSGIGLAYARAFASAGANIGTTYKSYTCPGCFSECCRVAQWYRSQHECKCRHEYVRLV